MNELMDVENIEYAKDYREHHNLYFKTCRWHKSFLIKKYTKKAENALTLGLGHVFFQNLQNVIVKEKNSNSCTASPGN